MHDQAYPLNSRLPCSYCKFCEQILHGFSSDVDVDLFDMLHSLVPRYKEGFVTLIDISELTYPHLLKLPLNVVYLMLTIFSLAFRPYFSEDIYRVIVLSFEAGLQSRKLREDRAHYLFTALFLAENEDKFIGLRLDKIFFDFVDELVIRIRFLCVNCKSLLRKLILDDLDVILDNQIGTVWTSQRCKISRRKFQKVLEQWQHFPFLYLFCLELQVTYDIRANKLIHFCQSSRLSTTSNTLLRIDLLRNRLILLCCIDSFILITNTEYKQMKWQFACYVHI